MFGPGATITGTAEDIYMHLDAVYDLTPAWQVNVGGIYGIDNRSRSTMASSTSRPSIWRSTAIPPASINGVTQSVSQTLTTANAIDLWGNGTSARTGPR
jgi:iron complex outermembrane receptor protein